MGRYTLPAVNLPDLKSVELLECLATPIWIFELDRHAIWWGNAAGQRFWKAGSLEELQARSFASDSATVRLRLRQIAREYGSRRGPTGRPELWTLYPAKEPVTVSVTCQAVRIRQGSPALLIEVVGDHSTHRDRQADRLVESVRYSGVVVSMFTMSGELLVQNASAFDCYGSGDTSDRLAGRFEDASIAASLLASVRASTVFDAELAVLTTKGRRIHRVKGHEGRDPVTGDVVLVLSEDDISDLIRLRSELSELNASLEQRVADRSALLEASQTQLLQAQKMEVIGQLTGGVAHDFNNLLAVILGNLELLQADYEEYASPDFNELIDTAIEAVTRGADLTKNMLAYARKARLAPTVLDLNQVIHETERWMRRTIEASIEIKTSLQSDTWPVCVDRSSLQSSLANLILNARDAMEGSGTLTIETANTTIDDDYTRIGAELLEAGPYVMVVVTDTGKGIRPENIEHIYDPFFTTKAIGKGSGLGLSMVDEFVRQSGGTIRVESEPGQGTSFKLYFPAAEHRSVAKSSQGMLPAPGKRVARILVTEDKAEVMAVLEKMLVAAGYSVTTARSGDMAYALFKADPSYDLVLTDLVMPGRLQGADFAKECRALNPHTPFVFLSGYASDSTERHDGIRPDDVRLMKPVARADLLRAIEARLSAGRVDRA